jgi:hypothetical protein
MLESPLAICILWPCCITNISRHIVGVHEEVQERPSGDAGVVRRHSTSAGVASSHLHGAGLSVGCVQLPCVQCGSVCGAFVVSCVVCRVKQTYVHLAGLGAHSSKAGSSKAWQGIRLQMCCRCCCGGQV